jgi:putative acetyltransferase
VTLAFRPARLPQEGEMLADLFVASVMELGADWYDEDELAAWVSAADDVAAFGARLAAMLTLIAVKDGEPVGFVALKGGDEIAMLYVAPDHAGEGVGTALVRAIETLAAHRGAKRLGVDATDNAKPLFDKLGYVAERRNTVDVGGVWLANTTLVKTLAQDQPGRH